MEWTKEKALFLQKIEHMEVKMNEYDEREKRLKNSHEKLMETISSMNNHDNDPNTKRTHGLLVFFHFFPG